MVICLKCCGNEYFHYHSIFLDNLISRNEYRENLDEAIDFLKGGSSATVSRLKAQMNDYSENLEFEKAAKVRDKIKAIERIMSRQKVVVQGSVNEDVFAIAQRGEKACLAVLSFREGLLSSSEHFIIDNTENLPEMRRELVSSFYSMERQIPPLIVLDGEISDSELLSMYLTEKRGNVLFLDFGQEMVGTLTAKAKGKKIPPRHGKVGHGGAFPLRKEQAGNGEGGLDLLFPALPLRDALGAADGKEQGGILRPEGGKEAACHARIRRAGVVSVGKEFYRAVTRAVVKAQSIHGV